MRLFAFLYAFLLANGEDSDDDGQAFPSVVWWVVGVLLVIILLWLIFSHVQTKP